MFCENKECKKKTFAEPLDFVEPKFKRTKKLERDMQAVRNAIIYEYNNGLAEGSVNKLKVIKRIMYGRNKFEMLRQKFFFLRIMDRIQQLVERTSIRLAIASVHNTIHVYFLEFLQQVL